MSEDIRIYAIPFEKVWQAASYLAGGGLRRWTLLSRDDLEGVIKAQTKTLVFRSVSDATVQISLDENGQTRVDVVAIKPAVIRRFLRALDKRLGANIAK